MSSFQQWLLASVALTVSLGPSLGCAGTTTADGSDDAAGGTSSGGSLASGGASSSGGAPGSGGQSSSGGQVGSGGGDCGPCPGYACQAPIVLSVGSQAATTQVNLADLTATGAGLSIDCEQYDACSGECVGQSLLADGHYSVTVQATGTLPAVVEFDIQNPTDCGCCGCCPGSASAQVVLLPDPEADGSRACCADLAADEANCGECGHACTDLETCQDGACVTL